MEFSKEQHLNWLAQVEEEIIDSAREIIDPHHHLWTSDRKIGETEIPQYILGDLWKDTGSGHNIVKTIFMECISEYFTEGPEHLRVIGETEFVATSAKKSLKQGKTEIAGIISHTDLTQNESILREVLSAHETAGQGLFRGIRHGGAHDPDKTLRWVDATPHKDLFALPSFRSGVRLLGELGYTYDSWHFHFQNESFANMARAVPETTIILDHFGIPCGVGEHEGRQSEVWERWKKGITAMAQLENVFVKIGGLAMPVNGFNWHLQKSPPNSDEVAKAHRQYYLHTIDSFGPHRCMFESNFPVDKLSFSYHVYWNAMKKIAEGFSESEQHDLFYGTASRVYKV